MGPRDPTTVPFAAAQAMVAAIWSDLGLRYPPVVEPLPRQAIATIARANRLSVFLPAQTPSWFLLHELGHAMTTTQDGRTDGHGPNFMGIYVQLLARYLRLEQADLLMSLKDAGIDVALHARPAFVDE